MSNNLFKILDGIISSDYCAETLSSVKSVQDYAIACDAAIKLSESSRSARGGLMIAKTELDGPLVIEIKKADLVECIEEALCYAGSTDWDVYLNLSGHLSVRHQTYDNRGYFEIIDLYSCTPSIDEDYGIKCRLID